MKRRTDMIMPRRIAARIVASMSLVIVVAGAPRDARAADAPAALFGPRPSAADVLSRITTRDAMLASYTVPVHIDVHLRKLFSLHFGMNGTQYFKQPNRLALDVGKVPSNARRLFSQISTPMTWADTYDMRLAQAASDGVHTTYRLEGVPKRGGDIDHVILDVDSDPSLPLHARWFCRDGMTIATVVDEQPAGPYWLPKHTEADLSASGYKIHVDIEYGGYNVNAGISDSVFSGV